MIDYTNNMLKEFPEELSMSIYPWNEIFSKVDEKTHANMQGQTFSRPLNFFPHKSRHLVNRIGSNFAR
jgi:hypothetical protein